MYMGLYYGEYNVAKHCIIMYGSSPASHNDGDKIAEYCY